MKRAQGDIALDLSDVADALFKCIRSNAVDDMPMWKRGKMAQKTPEERQSKRQTEFEIAYENLSQENGTCQGKKVSTGSPYVTNFDRKHCKTHHRTSGTR